MPHKKPDIIPKNDTSEYKIPESQSTEHKPKFNPFHSNSFPVKKINKKTLSHKAKIRKQKQQEKAVTLVEKQEAHQSKKIRQKQLKEKRRQIY